MFSESYIAAFQLMRINFNDGMDEIQSIVQRENDGNDSANGDARQLA